MDARVTELQCIMPLENVPSVLEHGILSYDRSARLIHRSVAMQAVQDIRETKSVPGGRRLHHYANLYFHARNPMMYKRQGEINDLCVLQVSTKILQLEGVVLSDHNAASSFARFLAPEQWSLLNFDAIFARYWTHPDDQAAEWRHKAQKCAEVLVPNQVSPLYLLGAHVCDAAVAKRLQSLGFDLAIKITPFLFFR